MEKKREKESRWAFLLFCSLRGKTAAGQDRYRPCAGLSSTMENAVRTVATFQGFIKLSMARLYHIVIRLGVPGMQFSIAAHYFGI